MRLRGSIVDAMQLTASDRDAMFRLMDASFANVRREVFEADLAAKRWVIRVHEPQSGELAGFSTQVLLTPECLGVPVWALYSGDTVVEQRHWGDPALAHIWGRLALELIGLYGEEPLYWFLTSKGFRTYRYLPMFFHKWFPRCGHITPKHEREVIDAIGSFLAPQCYDPIAQVIRAIAGKDYVRPGVSEPGGRAGRDEHVRFFLSRNPDYSRGDELCCLAPLTRENFTRAAYRVINATPMVHSVAS